MRTTIEDSPELHDKATESRRSKWSVMVDTAIKTARREVSRAERANEKEKDHPPSHAEKTPA